MSKNITFDIRCDSASGSDFTLVKPDSQTTVTFSDLGCKKQYGENFVKTGETCGPQNEGELVHVGFTTEDDNKFYWMYSSCHNAALAHNLYSHHVVLKSIGANDNNNDRPSFTKVVIIIKGVEEKTKLTVSFRLKFRKNNNF